MKKTIVLLAALTASMAYAQPRLDEISPMKKVEQLTADLGLTDDQKAKIQSSREKFRPQLNEKENAFNSAKNKFNTAIQNPNSSNADLETLYKQQEDSHRALQDVIFQSRMEFRSILTPEQRTKMTKRAADARKPIKQAKEKDKGDHVPPSATVAPVAPPTPVK